MNAAALARLNPDLRVIGLEDPLFAVYGRPFVLPGMASFIAAADRHIPLDPAANRYEAAWPELEALPESRRFAQAFAYLPFQVGFVAGPNSRLNGLEYHLSPELVIAVTDQALLLGRREELAQDFSFDVSRLVCLFLARGSGVELEAGTLHFSPCKVEDGGFKSVIVLPRGTNTALEADERDGEDRLLFMRNKWLIAHPEREPLVQKGAFPGIRGANIEVRYR